VFINNDRMNVIIDLASFCMSNGRLISIAAIQIQNWPSNFLIEAQRVIFRVPSNFVLSSHFNVLCHCEQLE
ncbi:hypothetical protein B5P41_30515, partial [Bacillus sp. SRB_28]